MGKWIFFKMFTGADLISAAVTITPTSPFIALFFPKQHNRPGSYVVWKDETVSVGFLEVLIAPIPSSLALFTDLPVVASAIPCRFDTTSFPCCGPLGENLLTLFRANLGYKYVYALWIQGWY